VLSGQGDIPLAVEAVKLGAFDFLEKRWPADAIVARVAETLRVFERCSEMAGRADAPPLPIDDGEQLAPRERNVLHQIMAAASIEEAAEKLGVSPRTIEVHRGHIMYKLGAKNVADLAGIVAREKDRPALP
jgi:FixJ family two-component response regulator